MAVFPSYPFFSMKRLQSLIILHEGHICIDISPGNRMIYMVDDCCNFTYICVFLSISAIDRLFAACKTTLQQLMLAARSWIITIMWPCSVHGVPLSAKQCLSGGTIEKTGED